MTISKRLRRKARGLIAMSLFVALSFLVIRAVAQHTAPGPETAASPGIMAQHSRMMGEAPGMMGMRHDSSTMAEMGVIHELVVNHDRIQRTVTNLSDGIRTVTESDDAQLAQLIKEHVVSMDRRVSAKNDPGLPMESPALKTILRNGDKVRTTVETMPKGVVVVQRSTDPETIAALQQHASEVSELVEGGMAAMHAAMMRQSAIPPQAHDQIGPGQGDDQHHADVNRRGDEVMGFDHSKTTHHFLLRPDGGVIMVEANDSKDTKSRDEIRQHLGYIAQHFSDGDFTSPMLIHAQTPPGVPAMNRLKAVIQYRFEETARGGLVRITTSNPEARSAIHEFLRFQIRDHASGDSGKVEKP